MKNHLIAILAIFAFSVPGFSQAQKEWTFLVFLNGHNSLDSFGQVNIDQMKEIGSSDQVNIVVQWASKSYGKTRRLFVEKGNLKVLEELPPVDMGDVNELVNFVDWAHRNFPAKKYFLNLWNHGSGWRSASIQSTSNFHVQDISYDEIYNTKITTEELGQALRDIQKLTGGPVELYATDACLMSMIEVASEVGSAAKFFAGSQANEPGPGWPYNKFLARWVANPLVNGGQLANILTEEYYTAYSPGGIYGKKEVTFSSLDLSQLGSVENEMQILSHQLLTMSDQQLRTAFAFLPTVQKFDYFDYKDLNDLLLMLKQNSPGVSKSVDSVLTSLKSLITMNRATSVFSKAAGLSVWVPNNKKEWDFKGSGIRYQGLTFHQKTLWGEVLKRLYP